MVWTAAAPYQPRHPVLGGAPAAHRAQPDLHGGVELSAGPPSEGVVLDPVLDPGHRDALPHVYEGDRLCLYTPGEWHPEMSLSKTIIPWTAEWLLHYEVWRSTGRSEGGGHVYAPVADSEAERALYREMTR